EKNTLATACLDNVGRAIIESYSTLEFFDRMTTTQMRGPGVQALEEAHERQQAVILVTGHFGNYEAARAAMVHKGYVIGAIYRFMANPYFNKHYVKTLHAFGGPGFPQGKRGTGAAVRHLKDGGKLILLFDQHVMGAPVLNFMGHPARTAISAAQLALKYDAVVIPYYAIRQADGLSFECIFEEPIERATAEEMTQAMNDSIEQQIRAHPEQWFWVPRRWRPDSE
ncbi:MAG: lysophospholipid acyltransferase family protein, partial [Rhodobacteraceae bacterium]|nr:lysophospholipid acyltransferase family protein [Paracoccaceae bacterium]